MEIQNAKTSKALFKRLRNCIFGTRPEAFHCAYLDNYIITCRELCLFPKNKTTGKVIVELRDIAWFDKRNKKADYKKLVPLDACGIACFGYEAKTVYFRDAKITVEEEKDGTYRAVLTGAEVIEIPFVTRTYTFAELQAALMSLQAQRKEL